MKSFPLLFNIWCLSTNALDGNWIDQQLLAEGQTTTVTLTSTIMSTVTAADSTKLPSNTESPPRKTVTYVELVTRHLMPDIFQSVPPFQEQQKQHTTASSTLVPNEMDPTKATVAVVILLDAAEP